MISRDKSQKGKLQMTALPIKYEAEQNSVLFSIAVLVMHCQQLNIILSSEVS